MKYDLLEEKLNEALTSSQVPDEMLNRRIEAKIRGMEHMNSKKRMRPVALAAAMVMMLAVSTFAAVKLWDARDISSEFGYNRLAEAFERGDALRINETVSQAGYDITLMGLASGKSLGQDDEDSTYAVVAIANSDGTPMPGKDDENYLAQSFFISPLIEGLAPWQYNIASMNGGYTEEVIDGVLYRLISCDNVEMFADRKMHLCVSDTPFFSTDAYDYDQQTGAIWSKAEYEGLNALFDLPLDPAKADPEQAQAYIDELWADDETGGPEEPGDIGGTDADDSEEVHTILFTPDNVEGE